MSRSDGQCFSRHSHSIQLSQFPASNIPSYCKPNLKEYSLSAELCLLLHKLFAILNLVLPNTFASSNLLRSNSPKSQSRCFRNLLFLRWPGWPCLAALRVRHLWRNVLKATSPTMCRGTVDHLNTRLCSPTYGSTLAKFSFTWQKRLVMHQ